MRPEHAKLSAQQAAPPLKGRLENVVYFGTDTHYHLRLEGGEGFIVRAQNEPGKVSSFAEGHEVGVEIGGDAVQVLRD